MLLLRRINKTSKMVGKLLRFKPVSIVSTRSSGWKVSYRDDKILFGKLLETKTKKERRLKLEKEGKIVSKPKNVYSSSEHEYLFEVSKKRIKVCFPSKMNTEVQVKKEEPRKESEESSKVNTGLSNSIETESQLQNSSSVISDEKIENVTHSSPKEVAPSKIIIEYMLTFPLIDSLKSSKLKHEATKDITDVISLSPNDDKSNLVLPSVTRILSATMSEASMKALAVWKEQMIQKLDKEGFDAYQEALFKDGHDLHSSIESFLLQKELLIPERIQPAFNSVQNVLKDISSVTALETHVVHPHLRYRGVVDCIATYRGELCLIDWKKSDKRKDTIESLYDAPIQVASYIGALNADRKYNFEVKKGLVVVAYTSGEEATVHELNLESLSFCWNVWLRRLQKYFVNLTKLSLKKKK